MTNEIYKEWSGMTAKEHKPFGLEANKKIAKEGGEIAKNTHRDIENKLGKTVITKDNTVLYQYVENKDLIDDK